MSKKFDENDPRLAAYAFGELSRAEADEVRRALMGRDDLQRVVDEFVVMGGMLSQGFGSEAGVKLRPEQRAAVHQAGKRPTAENVVSIREARWKRPFVVFVGAAAVLAFCFVVLKETSVDKLGGGDVVDVESISDEDLLSRVAPSDAEWNEDAGVPTEGGETGDAAMVARGMELQSKEVREEIARRMGEGVVLPKSVSAAEEEREWQLVSDQVTTRVPLVAGNASLKWIRESLAGGRLPEAGLVRVEEVLNAFDFEVGEEEVLSGVGISSRVVECPWDVTKSLLMLKVRNASEGEPVVEVGMSFRDGVTRYRLVGYGQSQRGGVAPVSVKLQAGYEHVVLYEIERSGVSEELALVHVGVAPDQIGTVAVGFPVEVVPLSVDERMVSLLATWCAWLRGGDADLKAKVLGLMGELGDEMGADERAILGDVEKSLGL